MAEKYEPKYITKDQFSISPSNGATALGFTSLNEYAIIDLYDSSKNNGLRFAFRNNPQSLVWQKIVNGSLSDTKYMNLKFEDMSVTTQNTQGYAKPIKSDGQPYASSARIIQMISLSNNIIAIPFIGDNGTIYYAKIMNFGDMTPVAQGTTALLRVVTI